MKDRINLDFFKAALIRAIKTIAQTALGMISVGMAISEINWGYVVSVSAVAGLVSLLTSIATGLPETTYDGTIINGTNGVFFDGLDQANLDKSKLVFKVKTLDKETDEAFNEVIKK